MPQQMNPLSDAAKFALFVALGCAHILQPILDFLQGSTARSPVLDTAVAVLLLTVPITYLLGVILVYLHVSPAVPVSPAALGRFAGLALAFTVASALLLLLVVALTAFLFLAVSQ